MATKKAGRETHEVGFPRRGDIFLVDFDPTIGAEIRKTRPALIVQNDIANQHSPITILAAITSKFDIPPYPAEVVMEAGESGLAQRSSVLLNQFRSVDRQRLIKRIGHARPETMQRVDQAIRISLGLTAI